MRSDRPVYVLAGEYSAPPEVAHPTAVFEKARGTANPGKALEDLMSRAGERALNMLALGDEGRLSVEQLLLTTMPDVGGSAIAHAIHLPNVLKRRLGLAERCQARFEIGSSDAGASLFASAVHLLRGLDDPSTALVVAGQTMPGGRDAIQTVAQVLDGPERELGMTMIAVGDLLVDLAAWQWRQEQAHRTWRPGLSVDEPCADGVDPGAEAFAAALEANVRHKLALAEEYPAAQRAGGEGPEGAAPLSHWMTDWHLARASVGACAVVLTTDEALVGRWLASSNAGRVVRVLGVGEGDADPRLSMRGEPFNFFKSLRQALVSLRRNTDTNHDFLRCSAFAVLHDAFPSIEHAFLLGLGFSPDEAMRRSRSYWPNPYGGLTAFGHALAASGLVQIAKAFHVFTRPDAYLPDPPGPLHVDFTGSNEPLHCVTASVGGPMSHIVATLLQSVPARPETWAPRALEPFRPRKRHRQNEPLVTDFEAKTLWVARLAERYREALAIVAPHHCGPGESLAVLEARTHFDLRLMSLPLPAAFVAHHAVSGPAADAALSAPTVEAAKAAVRRFLPEESVGAEAAREAAERRLFADLRVPVAITTGPPGPADEPGTVRAFSLVTAATESCGVGDLVVLSRDPAAPLYPVVVRKMPPEALPGLIPPWYAGMGGPGANNRPLLAPAERLRYVDVDAALQETSVLEVLGVLIARELTPAVMCVLQAIGTIVVERVLAAPELPAPRGALRLLHELVLQPEPSRWRLATALRELTGLPDTVPAPTPEHLAYCEFDLLGAGAQDTAALVTRLSALSDVIRKAEGWLAGAQITHGRVGDAFAVTVRQPLDAESAWRAMLRFALEVHHGCRVLGVQLRSGVSVGTGLTFPEVYGRFGAAGGLQKAVHLTLEHAAAFRRDTSDRRDGLAIVVTEAASEARAQATCTALWRCVGERPVPQVAFEGIPAAGDGVFADIRRP